MAGLNIGAVAQEIKNYCYEVQQNASAAIVHLKDLRNDSEFFLKICQVAVAALQLLMERYPHIGYLAKFQVTLATASMHDFYRFLQQPRRWFFPVDAMSIDENAILDSLEKVLCENLNVGFDVPVNPQVNVENVDEAEAEAEVEPEQAQERVYKGDSNVRCIAKAYLSKQLEVMLGAGDAYATVEDFKEALYNRFAATGHDAKGNRLKNDQGNFLQDNADYGKVYIATEDGQSKVKLYCSANHVANNIETFDLLHLSLADIKKIDVPLHHVPLVERLTNWLWAIVDLQCVALYLHGWNLLDTAKWAARIGQYPGFQWIKTQSLELWVRGLVCVAYSTKLLEACRKLADERLTDAQRRDAKWHRVTSLAELVYNGAGFIDAMGLKQISPTTIHWLAIAAKTIGLLEIVTKPRHKFFEIAAPAA